jgi:hypothetical protein
MLKLFWISWCLIHGVHTVAGPRAKHVQDYQRHCCSNTVVIQPHLPAAAAAAPSPAAVLSSPAAVLSAAAPHVCQEHVAAISPNTQSSPL